MTITQSVIEWLIGFDGGIEVDEGVSTDQLAANAEAYGIFRTPGDIVTEFVHGGRDVTTYLNLIVRQPSQTESMRRSNQAWMEQLEAWVRRQSMLRSLPSMDGGRECYAVAIANSFYMQEQTETESVYQITLSVHYTERR